VHPDPRPELTFGSLTLAGGQDFGEYQIELLADGMGVGSPQAVTAVVASLLQDGSFVQKVRDDNREATLRVRITGLNSWSLAKGEQVLAAEVGRRNTLVWTPPDGWGPDCVFDVLMSSLEFDFDDFGEVLTERRYALHLTCAPFTRSALSVDQTAIDATSGTATVVTLDDGTSLTGSPVAGNWTASGNVVPISVDAGRIKIVGSTWPSAANVDTTVVAIKTFTVAESLTGNPYVTFDFRDTDVPHVTGTVLTVKGVMTGAGVSGRNQMTLIATGSSPGGYKRFTFKVPAAATTLATVELSVTWHWPVTGVKPPSTGRTLYVDALMKSDLVPGSSTGRQAAGIIPVAGSARTAGSLAVEHATSSLGAVLLYTYNDSDGTGYQPPLRVWRTSGPTTTVDGTVVSGVTEVLDTAVTFNVPIALLPPGSYVLLARAKCDQLNYAFNWTAQSKMNGSLLGTALSGSRSFVTGAANTWRMHTIASMVLPNVDMDPSSGGTVQVTLVSAAPSSDNITFDEAWLFNLDMGSLTHVDAVTGSPSSGGPSNRLWIDQPSIDVPLPKLWVGTLADRSDSRHIAANSVAAWGQHSFEPPDVNVFVVTTNAVGASVTLSHYPRWHTHAAS
jgi:hypothetical protein